MVSTIDRYIYRAKILRVIDGDTLELQVDLGFGIHKIEKFRLEGIDCPEMNTPEGKAAREWVINWTLNLNKVYLETFKDKQDKYGRYLAKIWDSVGVKSLNELLLEIGHAKPY